MSAVGELARFPSTRWAAPPPLRCPRGHLMRPERIVINSTACSCGRHRTWRCHCGAVTYAPAMGEKCDITRRADARETSSPPRAWPMRAKLSRGLQSMC